MPPTCAPDESASAIAWPEDLPPLAGQRILVLGDAMLDRFVTGTVARVSPEAPVPVLHVAEQRELPGGAGNVLRNLTALGACVHLVAAVGEDDAGARLRALIEAADAATGTLVAAPGRATTVKTRYLAGGQQLLRSDIEDPRPLPETVRAELHAALRAALPAAAALVISDYGKGVLDPPLVRAALDAAARAGVPAVVDPKGPDYTRYRGARVVTPNQAELATATGHSTETDAETEHAARALAEGLDGAAILATRGPRGMTLVDGRGPARHLPAAAREVFDVSGAGDTVVAAVAAGLAAGLDLAEAARLANAAAGLVVGKVGTATVRPAELAEALRADRPHAGEAKRADAARAAEQAARWQRQGLRVGFTNGCFDLLHPGHLHLLDQARAACDRLIVAVNTDASVRRLKGPARPIQDESARTAVLAALASVDLVVPFAEDTPQALIAALRPDVLVKGADYAREAVIGAEQVEARGGRVVLVPLLPDQSTTRTLDRLRS